MPNGPMWNGLGHSASLVSVVDGIPCIRRLLPIAKPSARVYDFDDYERLIAAANVLDVNAYLIALLGGTQDCGAARCS